MADLNVPASDALAEQALNNLVNQFARPLDFLRELVQNSIDAGSPRVEIWLQYVDDEAGQGVLQIHIDDFGEGMDEHIIDNHLTRLFSSTKEQDLTKIGKFGIGFTSIFAIQPEAVLMHTGRHGEYWELLFHADRSYDKVKHPEPVDGTRITLYKRMAKDDVESFVRDSRWILQWWCEHSDTPITFWDRTGHTEQPTGATADPFAAFASPEPNRSGPDVINRPLDLGLELFVEHADQGVEVIVGYDDTPRYACYNGGLTLVNTRNADVLGGFRHRLGHLSFKMKSNRLEHTLTRDNVLQDEHWVRAMAVLNEAANQLRDQLVEVTEAAVTNGQDLARFHQWLSQEVEVPDGVTLMKRYRDRKLFRDTQGRGVSLSELEHQEDDQGIVLMETEVAPLARELDASGVILLQDLPETRRLLRSWFKPPLLPFLRQERHVEPAESIYIVPDRIPLSTLPDRELRFIQEARRLVSESIGKRLRMELGDFGGAELGRDKPLALEGPEDGRVFQRPEARWLRIPAFLRSRCLLVNRHHSAYRFHLAASVEDLALASFSLVQALLHEEDAEGDRAWQKLFEVAAE